MRGWWYRPGVARIRGCIIKARTNLGLACIGARVGKGRRGPTYVGEEIKRKVLAGGGSGAAAEGAV